MLSPRDDDDDDSHLCNKCNTTIVGLDNYVKHRKERCKVKVIKPDLPSIEPLEPTYGLGADVFFQSLELQSSVKKTSLSRLTPPISKPSIDTKNSLSVASTSRDIPRMSPLETNLRGEDWIGGHTLRISGNEDNQTKLINAVARISGAAKKEPSTSYAIEYHDDKGDDSHDDDSEESEETDEEDDDENVGKWEPLSSYTGGKWRPASPEQEEWDIRDERSATWKSLLPETNEGDEDYDAPPPDHTKGKWVPGASDKTQIMEPTIQSKGSVQYWCGPCNRRLGSRTIYDKHLRSSLHLKKMLPENELEFSGHLEPMKLSEKRSSRPSKLVEVDVDSQIPCKRHKESEKASDSTSGNQEKKKRKRMLIYITCTGCQSRVKQHLMGKHLISHYHFRKASNVSTTVYQQLVLDNIEAIVRQSPFQCSPCRFYTNWVSNFMQHWMSADHKRVISALEGQVWCSFCKYECNSSEEMLTHLSSPEHIEVIAVVNRSMPIIIRKKVTLKCACAKEFRYNVEVKKHCQATGHKLVYTATDDYQELHKCQLCDAKYKSSITLATHLKTAHNQKSYLCLVCQIAFETDVEVRRHRQTLEHRIKSAENRKSHGIDIEDLSRKCPHCEDVVLENILLLKEHIRICHPDTRKRCPLCGMEFILAQEVTRHVRSKSCTTQNDANLSVKASASTTWNCSQCLFVADSQSECLFHETLHSKPQKEVKVYRGRKKTLERYNCPLCPRQFLKVSLRQHLRQHTLERPFTCSFCGANFTRKSSLANHMKIVHGTDIKLIRIEESLTNALTINENPTEGYISPVLEAPISSKSAENVYRCIVEGCPYVTNNKRTLGRHGRSHGNAAKPHKCTICAYTCNQISHMKRHLISHKGIKPYYCPHCNLTTGSLENLRKHVLRSGRHDDLFLYYCDHCSYKANMAADLRTHLTMAHRDQYDMRRAIIAVKKHLMQKPLKIGTANNSEESPKQSVPIE